MKKIDVIYNLYGYIDEVSDNSIHFEQENESLQIDAKIETDKRVRAYIKAPNNNSNVTDELTPVEGVYSCVVDGAYMAKGTLYVGYELYDETGYIERLEPLKIYVDSFVNLGSGNSDNVYTVTIKIGEVKTVAFEQSAKVENVGTKKDMILNFDIPRGETGLKGAKGDKGDKGEKGDRGEPFTYSDFTEEELEGLKGPKGDKGDTGAQGIQGVKGDKGDRGAQGIQGKDGYTPVKGVDYFTPEDIESLGIEQKADWSYVHFVYEDLQFLLNDKVDKEDGKGLSTNDFTDALKTRLENNTFDYYHSLEYPNDFEVEFENLLNECTDEGVHLIFVRDRDDSVPQQYILTVGEYNIYGEDDVEHFSYQSLFDLTYGTLKVRDGIGNEWEKISVSQKDLNKAIGDVEASLENIIEKYGLGGDGV